MAVTATDGFGRAYFHGGRTGATSQISRRWCASARHPAGVPCPTLGGQPLAAYRTLAYASGAPTVWTYRDVLDREVLTVREGFANHEYIAVRTDYDTRARPYRKTEPFFTHSPDTPNVGQANGVSIFMTTTLYDALDRPYSITHPNGAVTAIEHQGLTTITTLPANADGLVEVKTQLANMLGEIARVTDAHGSFIETTYDSTGNAVAITRYPHDGASIATTAEYDALGRKTAMVDPDAGAWFFAYNAVGEQIKKWSTTTCTATLYDARGRAHDRKDYAKSSPSTQCGGTLDTSTSWEFDTASNSLGQLVKVLNKEDQQHQYTRTHSYDSMGREFEITLTFADRRYTQSVTFDQYGRPFQSFFRGGVPGATDYIPQSGEMYEYSDRGFSKLVRDAYPGSSGAVYSEVTSQDERGNAATKRLADNPGLVVRRQFEAPTGRLSTIQTANGTVQNLLYQYDAIGNLAARSDLSSGVDRSELFHYDALQRLTSTQIVQNGTAVPAASYGYDAIGNLLRPGAVYDRTRQSRCTASTDAAPGPGAMTKSGQTQFCYDARGNLTKRSVPASGGQFTDRIVKYTPFDQVREVAVNGTAGLVGKFVYGPGRERVSYQESGSGGGRTIYFGNAEIKTVDAFTPREVRRYAGEVVISRRFDTAGRVLTTARQYLLTDAQGSTHRIADGNGFVVTNSGAQAFTPFGARAALATGAMLGEQERYNFDASATSRGYTGHQQYDGLGIVHMGGRIYDAEMGRFLQADPFVQDPTNVQNLNRYSYVNNNPLSYTDPSGYWGRQQQGYLRQAVAIAISVWAGGAAAGKWGFLGIESPGVIAMSGGFAAGAVSTGNLRGAVLGTFSASIGHGASILAASGRGGAAIAFGAAGGGMVEAMNGGRFGHGFVSAGLGALLAPHLDTGSSFATGVARTIAGGAIAEVTGGNFESGAATAAFAYAFDQAAGGAKRRDGAGGKGAHPSNLSRSLTVGELESAKGIYGEGMDWSRVVIWNKKYWLFQKADQGISPDGGNIYMGSEAYMHDYSVTPGDMSFLIHELSHVWQKQNGFRLDIPPRGYDYTPQLRDGKGWSKMSSEGQGEVITDLYLQMNHYRPTYGAPVSYSQEQLRSLIPFAVPAYDSRSTPWSRGW